MGVSTKPNVMTVKFGDGYEQRRRAGLNSLLKSYTPTFRVTGTEQINAVRTFLEECAGCESFLWRSPLTNTYIKVVCGEWDIKMDVTYADFSCKFNEVIA